MVALADWWLIPPFSPIGALSTMDDGNHPGSDVFDWNKFRVKFSLASGAFGYMTSIDFNVIYPRRKYT
jgi:hypothetical protein